MIKMKKEELRLGNLVFSKETGEVQKITGVDEENIYLNCITFDYQTIEDIEPIPLTEEWLLKLGFKLYISGYYCIDILDDVYLAYGKEYDKELYLCVSYSRDNTSSVLKNIKYVNQLQNLIFALTQKGLEL